MAKIIWIVVLFVGLPAGIYLALNDALADQQSKWYQAVVKDYPPEQQQFALESLCDNSILSVKVDLSQVCRPYRNTQHLRVIAVGLE